MAWARVDDGLHKSVKWRRASKGARALWTTSLSWAMDELTDGYVPHDLLSYLGGTKADAKSLVDCGLWIELKDGWQFHDWADYQPSRAKVIEERAKARERQKRLRASKAVTA